MANPVLSHPRFHDEAAAFEWVLPDAVWIVAGLAWVVESGGDVCGFLIARSVASDEAEILNLAVAAASRRAGNATARDSTGSR